jgi:1-phosphatidylinositol-3-phosphate 5-kinase
MSLASWSISFGKYLELCFYASDVTSRSAGCTHSLFRDHVRYFYYNGYVREREK